MDYITTKEAVKNWGITDRIVVYHCSTERIKRAKKMANIWLVPADRRYRSSKVKDGKNK